MRIIIATMLGASFALLGGCGQTTNESSSIASQTALAPPPGAIMELYNRSCRSCHSTGAGGAPRTGARQDWEARVRQGSNVLLDHTISGYKGMPPMGMCMDCDEEQFLALIEYMAGQKLEAQ